MNVKKQKMDRYKFNEMIMDYLKAKIPYIKNKRKGEKVMNSAFNVKFIECEDKEIDKGRIYYISEDGKRHWIPDIEVAKSYGWNLEKVERLSYDEILTYPLSYSIARNRKSHIYKFPSGKMTNGIHRIPVRNREFFGADCPNT